MSLTERRGEWREVRHLTHMDPPMSPCSSTSGKSYGQGSQARRLKPEGEATGPAARDGMAEESPSVVDGQPLDAGEMPLERPVISRQTSATGTLKKENLVSTQQQKI